MITIILILITSMFVISLFMAGAIVFTLVRKKEIETELKKNETELEKEKVKLSSAKTDNETMKMQLEYFRLTKEESKKEEFGLGEAIDEVMERIGSE